MRRLLVSDIRRNETKKMTGWVEQPCSSVCLGRTPSLCGCLELSLTTKRWLSPSEARQWEKLCFDRVTGSSRTTCLRASCMFICQHLERDVWLQQWLFLVPPTDPERHTVCPDNSHWWWRCGFTALCQTHMHTLRHIHILKVFLTLIVYHNTTNSCFKKERDTKAVFLFLPI